MTRHTADLEDFVLNCQMKKELKARNRKHARQRKQWGFCDEDCWNLFYVIAKFVLPRLVRFREMPRVSYPNGLSTKQWSCILDKIIAAFKILVKDDLASNKEACIVRHGLKLFAKWFEHLWD